MAELRNCRICQRKYRGDSWYCTPECELRSVVPPNWTPSPTTRTPMRERPPPRMPVFTDESEAATAAKGTTP